MNYKLIYDNIIKRANKECSENKRNDGYFEIHHIVPKSLGR